MKWLLPHLIWVSGVFVIFVGFCVGPGIPFQHPTPDLRALEAKQEWLCGRFLIAGMCLCIGGIAWVLLRVAWRCLSKKNLR